MTLRIILAGPRGRMGTEAIKMINRVEHFSLVACIDRKNDSQAIGEIQSLAKKEVPVYTDVMECFEKVEADVFVELSIPEVGFLNTKAALEHHVHAVVGTSGFSEAQINHLTDIAKVTKTGCIIAPNFSIGGVLMMQFAKMAAKYFPDVEIIEKHHDRKIDAPSGTALNTVELIKQTRKQKQQGHPEEYETVKGSRGGDMDGIHIHSMRLPGLVAHQEIVFGGKSQLLTIKHDSLHRKSFMEGLQLAMEKVVDQNELLYGLEHVMDIFE
jgi:4-hydroxy-tetrahydrodipicolinate reductase